MKKLKLEVKAKNIGNAVGTSGWLRNLLNDANLKLGKTQKNLPCIALKYKEEGQSKSKLIAFVSNDPETEISYVSHGENVYSLYPVGDDYQCYGFENYLTNSTKKVVKKLIYDTVEVLKKYLHSDEVNFEVKIMD